MNFKNAIYKVKITHYPPEGATASEDFRNAGDPDPGEKRIGMICG